MMSAISQKLELLEQNGWYIQNQQHFAHYGNCTTVDSYYYRY